MTVRLRLSDGIRFDIHEELAEVVKGVQNGLQDRQVIPITNPEGKVRMVNPFQVLYFEEIEEAEET